MTTAEAMEMFIQSLARKLFHEPETYVRHVVALNDVDDATGTDQVEIAAVLSSNSCLIVRFDLGDKIWSDALAEETMATFTHAAQLVGSRMREIYPSKFGETLN